MSSKNATKKILILCPYTVGFAPSQRLKYEQYFESWKANGYEIEVSPFMSKRMEGIVYTKGNFGKKLIGTLAGYIRRIGDICRLRNYDIVYVFLWATPFGPPIMEWIVCKIARNVIYDIDDMKYKVSTSPNNKYIKFLKSGSKVDFLLKNANRVLVSTDRIMDYARQYTQQITIIPATIDVNKYSSTRHQQSNKVVIGWSGSHTTSKYLHLLDSVLRKLSLRGDVSIMVMGDKDFKIDGLDITLLAWSPEKEVEYLQLFDIGLHPVPDEEWVYGKSGGKLVQYMAVGIPTVASAIGPNFVAIKDGYNGFLVLTDEEWIDKLETLINNAILRKHMGANARKYAEDVYSVEANATKYLSVFSSLNT